WVDVALYAFITPAVSAGAQLAPVCSVEVIANTRIPVAVERHATHALLRHNVTLNAFVAPAVSTGAQLAPVCGVEVSAIARIPITVEWHGGDRRGLTDHLAQIGSIANTLGTRA